jgi:hypothetical protein
MNSERRTYSYRKNDSMSRNNNMLRNNNIPRNTIFKHDIEPVKIADKNKNRFTILNPQALLEKTSSGYGKIKNYDNTGKNGYISSDPRLISSVHMGQKLVLDRPSVDSNLTMKQVLDDKTLDTYSKPYYASYNDINTGYITYYIDSSIKDVLFNPLFTDKSYVDGYDYVDPMETIKPHYTRRNINYIQDSVNTPDNNYEDNLSWINDSTEHREDIINKQMAIINQQKYSARRY